MAPDTPPDDDLDAEPDPWADIVADGLRDDGDQGAFDFADLDIRPPEPVSEPVTAPSPDRHPLDHVAADGADDGVEDDAFADVAADGSASAPSLSVFAPDDAAGWDASSTDSDAFAAEVLDEMAPADAEAAHAVVTDGSAPAAHEADGEEFGWATADPADSATGNAAEGDGAAWGDVVAVTMDDEDDPERGIPAFSTDGVDMAVGSTLGAAAGAAVATGADAARRAPRRPARAKGGLGQFVGIVLGGALAIPIVLGILIATMWMGRPDPIGMRRWLPGASFLLPPARPARAGGGEQARDLDSLSAADGSLAADRVESPPADSEAPAAADAAAVPSGATAPVAAVAGDAAATVEPSDATSNGPAIAAIQPPADLLAAIPVPAVPDSDALAALATAPPEPEPLDLATLDAAVERAAAAAVILDGADADDPDRRRHMVAWYRSLAQVAEELAAVEALAVASGRPFDEAAVRLDQLVAGLSPDGPLGGDLARLARNWLTYSRRDSDGAVLPVTFQSARPVGPYWCSKVVIEDAGGEARELAVVSRQRPFLEFGERCVVTGVLFDGGTIWAADVRSTDTQHPVPDVGDVGGDTGPVRSSPGVPDVPRGAADAPVAPSPDADAPPRNAPSGGPDIEVPEIPVPDIGVPAPPAPATPPQSASEPPAAGSDTPASDDF